MSTIFQYATFIAGGNDPPGSIGEVSLDPTSPSLFSFLCLVGCTHFHHHSSAFEHRSPYHSISTVTSLASHTLPLSAKCVAYETIQLLKKSLWVISMWNAATQNDNELLPMSEYSWERLDDKLNIVWEILENITRVQEWIEYILKGCRCKTGCQTRRRKYQQHETPMKCGPGCHCTNCTKWLFHLLVIHPYRRALIASWGLCNCI